MKRLAILSIAVAAGALAFAPLANATSCGAGCNFTEDVSDFLIDPGPLPVAVPVATTGTFNSPLLVSVSGQYRSPYENGSPQGSQGPGYGADPYSSVQGGGSATFHVGQSNALSLLWGSPDEYNSLQFYSGDPNAGGSLLYTIVGSLLIQTYGHDQVDVSTNAFFDYVVLSSKQNSFEFAGLSSSCDKCAPPPEVPLPGALPLLASGLGMIGLLGWRRKKKNRAVLSA